MSAKAPDFHTWWVVAHIPIDKTVEMQAFSTVQFL